MIFVCFFLLGRYLFSMFPRFFLAMFPLETVAFGFHNHHKDSMAFDANHGGVSPLAAWTKNLCGKLSNEKRAPGYLL